MPISTHLLLTRVTRLASGAAFSFSICVSLSFPRVQVCAPSAVQHRYLVAPPGGLWLTRLVRTCVDSMLLQLIFIVFAIRRRKEE